MSELKTIPFSDTETMTLSNRTEPNIKRPPIHTVDRIEIEMIVIDDRLHKYGLPSPKIGDAGVDLRAVCNENVVIKPGCTHVFGTGVKIHIANPNFFMAIYPRSGLGSKGGIIANSTGIIDSNYMGEIKIHLYNRGKTDLVIEPFSRIVQGVIQRVYTPFFKVVKEFTDYSDRGEGGFGSSGAL